MTRATPATRQRFIAWLGALPPEKLVGERQDCGTCPLATFLVSLDPKCDPHVAEDGWTRNEGWERWRPLPAWASAAMQVADALNDRYIYADVLRRALRDHLGWKFPLEPPT